MQEQPLTGGRTSHLTHCSLRQQKSECSRGRQESESEREVQTKFLSPSSHSLTLTLARTCGSLACGRLPLLPPDASLKTAVMTRVH